MRPLHSPRRSALAAAVVVALAAAAPAPLAAQRLEIALPARAALATEAPEVRGIDLLADPRVRDLLRNGFPARFHYRIELWSASGWFNDLKRRSEWDVIVRYDPLDKTYRFAYVTGEQGRAFGPFSTEGDLREALELPMRAPIAPPRGDDRYYYNLTLDIEILSMSDLDELEQWLRGEFRPAVRGRRNPGTALGRGLRTLVVRLLGGERRHYELRSATFRPDGR